MQFENQLAPLRMQGLAALIAPRSGGILTIRQNPDSPQPAPPAF